MAGLWSGIGRIAVGMARQGFDLQLTRYDDRGWRATFHTTGMEHSPTSATGSAWERTPWHATQWTGAHAVARGPGRGMGRAQAVKRGRTVIDGAPPESTARGQAPHRLAQCSYRGFGLTPQHVRVIRHLSALLDEPPRRIACLLRLPSHHVRDPKAGI
jgi:hypothetical protein